ARLGAAWVVVVAGAVVLGRLGLRAGPAVPGRPVPGLQRGGHGLVGGAAHPVHARQRVFGDRDEPVVVVVQFQVHLDRDVFRERAQDGVDSGQRGRITD